MHIIKYLHESNRAFFYSRNAKQLQQYYQLHSDLAENALQDNNLKESIAQYGICFELLEVMISRDLHHADSFLANACLLLHLYQQTRQRKTGQYVLKTAK